MFIELEPGFVLSTKKLGRSINRFEFIAMAFFLSGAGLLIDSRIGTSTELNQQRFVADGYIAIKAEGLLR